jgi:mono/diheme cytochrome c family protein
MLPFEAIMTDKQIADVLTYIRNSWGSKSSTVSEQSVRSVRKSVVDVKRAFQQSDFR